VPVPLSQLHSRQNSAGWAIVNFMFTWPVSKSLIDNDRNAAWSKLLSRGTGVKVAYYFGATCLIHPLST